MRQPRLSLPLLLSLALSGPAVCLCAQPDSGLPVPSKRVYTATRIVGQSPSIDGHLNDAAWQTLGTWASDYLQREPREGAAPSFPTELKILYDNRHLYVAIRAHQPDAATAPRLMGARDEFSGDMVGIAFDSYHNLRTAFEFDVTSGGSKIDLILKNDGSADTSWNAVWDVKTSVSKGYWCAEYAIPLSQLRYAQSANATWGLHSWRWLRDRQEESNWNLLPMDNKGLVYSFGELTGLENLPVSQPIEFTPYILAKTHRYGAEPGNPFRPGRDSSIDGGLDLKYGVGSDSTLDLTINPDFSQVEADPSEINLSTVETFRAERRPFFLEGKDLFDFRLDDDYAFYTRRIGDAPSLYPLADGYHDRPSATRILGSAKLTGRNAQGLSFGLLHATTNREETKIFSNGLSSSELAEPLTNSTVLRLQQDLHSGDTLVGALFSSNIRQGSSSALRHLPARSFTGGLDITRYFADREFRIDARLLATRISGSTEAVSKLMLDPVHNYQRPDAGHIEVDPAATHLDGHAGTLSGGRASGTWRWTAFSSWRSPGVDFNDLGYLQSADFLSNGLRIQYYNTNTGSLLRRRDLRLRLFQNSNFEGLVTSRQILLETELASLSGAYLWSRAGVQFDRTDTRILRGGPALRLGDRFPLYFYAETAGGKTFQLTGDGEFTNYQNGSLAWKFAPGLTCKLNGHLKTSLILEYDDNRQRVDYAGTADSPGGPVYLVGRLHQRVFFPTLRVNLNLTPTFSFSYYGGPFATVGRYSDFRAVTAPRASAEADRFTSIALSSLDGKLSGHLNDTPLSLNSPDFDWREFKSNLVLRWEYRPGSTLTCVWSQYRSDWSNNEDFSPSTQSRALFAAHPDNTLLLKLSYWFTL